MSHLRSALFAVRLALLGLLVVSSPSILASPFEYPGELSPSTFPLQGVFSPDRFPRLAVTHNIAGTGQFEGTPFTFTPNPSQHSSLGVSNPGETAVLDGSLTVGLRNEHSNNFGIDYKVFDEWNDFEVTLPPNLLMGRYPNVPFPVQVDFNGSTENSEFLYTFEIRGFRIVQSGPATFTPLPFLPSIDLPIFLQLDMPVELQAVIDVWVDLVEYDLVSPVKIVEDGLLAGSANMRATVLGPLVSPFPSVISFPPVTNTRYFDLDHMESLDISVLTGSFSPSWAAHPGDILGDNLTFSVTTDLQIAMSLDRFDFDMDGTYVVPESSSMLLVSIVVAMMVVTIRMKRTTTIAMGCQSSP